MKLQRCFQEAGLVGYTSTDRCEFVVLFQPPRDLGEQEEAATLFGLWDQVPADAAGVPRRTVLFFPRFTDDPAAGTRPYIMDVVRVGRWNRFNYWRKAEEPPQEFPTGKEDVSSARQWVLSHHPPTTWPQSLSDLALVWHDRFRDADGRERPDVLTVTPKAGAWRVQGDHGLLVSTAKLAVIDFAAPTETSIGAVELEIIESVLPDLPIEFGFSRVRAPAHGQFRAQRVMKARAFHALSPGGKAAIALDPRDAPASSRWYPDTFTRIELAAGTRLVTNFLSDKGLAAVFGAGAGADRGRARLHLDVNSGSTEGTEWRPSVAGTAAFVVEGEFDLEGFVGVPDEALDRSRVVRLLTGSAPTECVHARVGDRFKFVPHQPAALHVDGDPLPADPETGESPPAPSSDDELRIHAGGTRGVLTTSWMTVMPSAERQAAVAPTFVTETTTSPLFKPPNGADGADEGNGAPPLPRAHVQLGRFTDAPVPVFPWAGRVESGAADEVGDTASAPPDYEATHLAPARRLLIKKAPPDGPQDGEAPALEYAVTPQGLIASIQGGVDFHELFFGRPDPDGESTAEFKVTLNVAATDEQRAVFESVQRALRAEDLFLVVRDASEPAQQVFHPTDVLGIRQFRFGLKLDEMAGKNSVLLIKYFRGKSLEQLAADQQFWACRQHLAPGTTPKDLTDLAKLDGNVGQSAWDRVWRNADWQGVVMLNFQPTGTPELLEALGAGMDDTKLKFHHAGLDFLPVRRGELGNPPERAGSAFALLRYNGEGASVPVVTTGDYEPMDAGEEDQTSRDKRSYSFKVDDLAVLITDSQIRQFEASVRVGFTHLFWDATVPSGGGTVARSEIELKGSYEARKGPDGKQADIFKLINKQEFPIDFAPGSWIKQFKIGSAELNVTRATTAGGRREVAFFVGFRGELTFDPANQAFSELFTVERIVMERGGLELTYSRQVANPPPAPPDKRVSCAFKTEGVRAEAHVNPSKTAFLSLLPVEFKGFHVALGKVLPKLPDLGFLNIALPDTLPVPSFHFALELELDLGFLGKLSGIGRGLKLPALLGWRAHKGGYCFGIRFPNWNGQSFEIGIQQFVAVRAETAALRRCDDGMIAIAFAGARLVLFGREWPDETKISLALFVPVESGRKMGWIIGVEPNDDVLKYIAAGHRVLPPAGSGAVEIVDNCREYLSLKDPGQVCSLAGKHDAKQDGWLVAAEFVFGGTAHVWLALSDGTAGGGLYALHLKLAEIIEIGASYRRVNDDLGVFSAQVNLAETIPPLQFGAATVRLPRIRTEVFTDGGWLLDIGYPWNRDFRDSVQVEVAIFLGSGGMFFGYTAAVAADALAVREGEYGYQRPDANHKYLKRLKALRAGFMLRVGIGRSLDLGVLKGEASLTIYGGLEGALAFRPGTRTPELYHVGGVVGLMVHIWAELDFVVLQARAEVKAYVEFGFQLRRVAARKTVDGVDRHYALAVPFTVFAEVGIYVHFEVWVTIGCIRVKLFDLTFSATWRVEDTFGDLREMLLPDDGGDPAEADLRVRRLTRDGGAADARDDGHPHGRLLVPGRPRRQVAWTWPERPADEPTQSLPLFVMVLPCVADPVDVDRTRLAGEYVPCVVGHLMLRVSGGFLALAQYMAAWALDINPADDPVVARETVLGRREDLRANALWEGAAGARVLETLKAHFQVALEHVVLNDGEPVDIPPERGETKLGPRFVPVPAWPGVTIRFGDGNPQPMEIAPNGRGVASARDARDGAPRAGADAGENAFIDFVRLTTLSVLAETERLIRLEPRKESSRAEDMGSMHWKALWDKLAPPPGGGS